MSINTGKYVFGSIIGGAIIIASALGIVSVDAHAKKSKRDHERWMADQVIQHPEEYKLYQDVEKFNALNKELADLKNRIAIANALNDSYASSSEAQQKKYEELLLKHRQLKEENAQLKETNGGLSLTAEEVKNLTWLDVQKLKELKEITSVNLK